MLKFHYSEGLLGGAEQAIFLSLFVVVVYLSNNQFSVNVAFKQTYVLSILNEICKSFITQNAVHSILVLVVK